MNAPGDRAPIAATDRVLDVLARDEGLVNVFVRHSTHFEKLRSPAIRRVMARLVTVEQAARIAGVAVDLLVGDLNAALRVPLRTDDPSAGERRGDSPASRGGDSAAASHRGQHPSGWQTVELDLRADMRAGREPFSRIMAAVGSLDHERALRLRTIFEPVPLFALLAKRGFLHESRQDARDDWSVWFWRGATAAEGAASSAPSEHQPVGDELWLDVRGLEPPEPMLRTLAALETLPEGQQLVQINVRVPQLLLPVLAERGFAWDVDDSASDRVLVRIRRPARH
jgi:uncharacterized protein (DUF2249 family)